MCALEERLSIRLFTTGRCQQPLPTHARIRHLSLLATDDLLRPGRLFAQVRPAARRLVTRHSIKPGAQAIWHPTYYSKPSKWKGPVVVTVLDMIHEKFPDLLRGRLSDELRGTKRQLVQRADAVICISESTKRDLLEYYECADRNVYVIPLAQSEVFRSGDAASPAPASTSARPFLLYVGGRQHYKNFDILLRSYSLWKHHADVDLIVVGSGWS